MKVYAMREMATEYGYMPVRGYHSSLEAAKKQAKALFNKTAEWDVALYEVPAHVTLDMWVSMLNADSVSADLDGDTPRDFLKFIKIVFESAALKRYRKEQSNENRAST